LPFGNESFIHPYVDLLTVEQALADYAVLITALRTQFNAANSRVIAFGGRCVLSLSTVTMDSIVFVGFFFSVCTITHEPLHLARWNSAQTCILTTARKPENWKVIGQRSRSHDQIFSCFTVTR